MIPQHAAQSDLYAGLAASRPVLARNIGLGVCLGLCFFVSGNAQSLPSSASGAAVVPVEKQLPVPLTLHYDDPVTFSKTTTKTTTAAKEKAQPFPVSLA